MHLLHRMQLMGLNSNTNHSEDPLASNFSILLGSIEITVPDVTPADDYEIVCAYASSYNLFDR